MGILDALKYSTGDPDNDAQLNRGLLAMGLQLMGARGHNLFGAFGEAGATGLQAADQTRQMQQQTQQRGLQNQMARLQLGQAQRADEIARLPGRFYRAPSAPGVDATGGPETALEAPNNAAGPGGFDSTGHAQALMSLDPMAAMKLKEQQQKIAHTQFLQDTIAKLFGQQGGGLGAANAATMKQTGSLAPTTANAAVQGGFMGQQPQRGGIASLPPEAVALDLARNDGKGLASELFQRTRPNVDFVSGVAVDKNNLPQGFTLPQMNPSGQGYQLMPDGQGGFQVVAPKGALQTYSDYKTADAMAAAGVKPQEVWNQQTQRMELMPVTKALGLQSGGSPSGSAQVPPPGSPNRPVVDMTAGNSERLKIMQDELAREAAKPQSAGRDANISALRREMASIDPRAAMAPAGGMPTGPSVREKAAAAALTMGNEPFMKESYYPTLEAGKAAQTQLVSIQTARNAMRNMGNTGWGTPTKAAAAAVLGALGVPQANEFAANAQQFQQAGMTRLWEVLNTAKGPQTEGDAKRASATFAQIQDTTKKNMYTLDLMQAAAEREQMKAQFFQRALPIAQGKGDLQEVEREWASRAPSVFSMPSMKRWSQ